MTLPPFDVVALITLFVIVIGPVNYLLLKNIEVSGIQVSDYRKRCPDLMRQCFDEILDYAARGSISRVTRSSWGKMRAMPWA